MKVWQMIFLFLRDDWFRFQPGQFSGGVSLMDFSFLIVHDVWVGNIMTLGKWMVGRQSRFLVGSGNSFTDYHCHWCYVDSAWGDFQYPGTRNMFKKEQTHNLQKMRIPTIPYCYGFCWKQQPVAPENVFPLKTNMTDIGKITMFKEGDTSTYSWLFFPASHSFVFGCFFCIRPFLTWRIIPVSKWLLTMVIVSPIRIRLWDPFQMAFWWLINGGDPNHLRYLGWSSKYSILRQVVWFSSLDWVKGRCQVADFTNGTGRLVRRRCLDDEIFHPLKMGVEPKIGGNTPQIIQFNRVFHYKPSILGVFPLFLETPKFGIASVCLELGWRIIFLWANQKVKTWRIIPGFVSGQVD